MSGVGGAPGPRLPVAIFWGGGAFGACARQPDCHKLVAGSKFPILLLELT